MYRFSSKWVKGCSHELPIYLPPTLIFFQREVGGGWKFYFELSSKSGTSPILVELCAHSDTHNAYRQCTYDASLMKHSWNEHEYKYSYFNFKVFLLLTFDFITQIAQFFADGRTHLSEFLMLSHEQKFCVSPGKESTWNNQINLPKLPTTGLQHCKLIKID